jgi:hypothetical protein
MTKTTGNVYTIEYASDPQSGAYYPAKIAYTGNASTDCRQSVTFVREGAATSSRASRPALRSIRLNASVRS